MTEQPHRSYNDDYLLSMTGWTYADFVECSQQFWDKHKKWVSPEQIIEGRLSAATKRKEAMGLGVDAALPKDEVRISWDSYFLGLAHMVARRSIDSQTKHGCILVDQHKHIIGVGYNSHGRGLPASLPRSRPDKYPWMIHAEENAITNCTTSPWMIPGGLTAYITGHPCFHCAYLLRQATIKKIIYSGTKRWLQPPKDEAKLFEELISAGDFTITQVKPDLNWLFDQEILDEFREMGYIK